MADHGEFDYHYNREERLSMSNAPDLSRRSKRGFLKGNRALIILLIDILLICLLFVAFRYFIYKPPNVGQLTGYALSLRGMSLGDRVVVSLRVERRNAEAPLGRVYAVFRIEDAELRLSRMLPADRGEVVELTGTLFVAGRDRKLTAEVQIGQERRSLSRKLQDE
jgi:hypothetical protein